jgi:hypothetical protein
MNGSNKKQPQAVSRKHVEYSCISLEAYSLKLLLMPYIPSENIFFRLFYTLQ